jgi:hypothetical protein
MIEKKYLRKALHNLRGMDINQSLRFTVERFQQEMERNRQIRLQRESEYENCTYDKSNE